MEMTLEQFVAQALAHLESGGYVDVFIEDDGAAAHLGRNHASMKLGLPEDLVMSVDYADDAYVVLVADDFHTDVCKETLADWMTTVLSFKDKDGNEVVRPQA